MTPDLADAASFSRPPSASRCSTWCGDPIVGDPVDEHGTVYDRLCFDSRRARLWPELAREGEATVDERYER
jgi:hypothetical protein